MSEENKTTALHEYVIAGDLKAVEKLILKRSNSLGERDEKHRTALHLSILHNNINILEWLLIARTNRALKSSLDINAVDINGNSALHLAFAHLHLLAATMLLKDDASLYLPNHTRETPIFVLFRELHLLKEENLSDITDIIDLVIEKGYSFGSCNSNGDTPLHILLSTPVSPIILKVLLEKIISKEPKVIETTNKAGISIFEEIVKSKNFSLLPLLPLLLSHSPSPPLCHKVIGYINDEEMKQLVQDYIDDQEATDFVVLGNSTDLDGFTGEIEENLSQNSSGSVSVPFGDHFSKTGIRRRTPGLITRCRTLQSSYPDDHVEVKVLALVLDSTFVTKLNVHMQVKQAIAKLREHETLARIHVRDVGLYLPAKGSSSVSSPNVSRTAPSLQRDCNEATAVWLDPELCLWHYGITNGDLISLKRLDNEVNQFLWIKILVHAPREVIQKTVRIRRGMKVSELKEYLHSIFVRVANQYMALYLYDEHHEGHWMEKEEETIEFYDLRQMDIIELKEKSVFKIAFMDGSETANLSCSAETKIVDIVKMIICSISSIVDDPTTVGLCCVKKDNNLLEPTERIWLSTDKQFGDFNLHAGDEIHLMGSFGDPNCMAIARLIIHSDPHSSKNFIPRRDLTEIGGDIPLLGGEQVLIYRNNIRYMGVGQFQKDGILFVTNAHLVFARQAKGYLDYSQNITLGSIARIERPATGNFLDIYCKDLRTIRFAFLDSDNASQHRKELYDVIYANAFPKFYQVFAFHHRIDESNPSTANVISTTTCGGGNMFDIESEFNRMGVSTKLWRITNINHDYSYCSTYPTKFIVPASFDDESLSQVFPFRSKGRISILTYYHPNTATITRCSQPKVGVTNARSEADENLTNAIRLANTSNPNTLYLFDARPKANAIANQAIGMGYERISESSGRYQNCKLEFLNIDNIHVMRDAYYKVQRLCETTYKDDKNFLTSLDNSHWLSIIKLLLSSSAKIARIVDRGCSVLLHCSDGWDRTAQLAALAQIFLSPNYRTIEGFQILIEKDWLSVGHKFGFRCGHANATYGDEQRSPIFLQFIDCVWQCTIQFPCLFEFNEKFLLDIMENVYSCHYGNFLMNNERERVQANLSEITVSLWDHFAINREQYLNPFYLPGLGVIYPSTYYEDLRLWKGYYLRYCRTPNPYQRVTSDLRAMQLKALNDSLQSQIQMLKEQLQQNSQEQNSQEQV